MPQMRVPSTGSLARLGRAPGSVLWYLVVGAVATLWPVYVFGSSQVAWLASTVLLAGLAWDLSRRRSPLLAALLLGVVAILGTEASGELAAGTAPLGPLRTLDAVVFAALLARLPELWSLPRNWRPSAPVMLVFGIAAYAVLLWVLNGLPTDGVARADVRLAGLMIITAFAVKDLRPWKPVWVARAAAVLVLLTAVKAGALYLADYWTIGTYDRIQASTVQPPGEALRIILVGGDSLLIVAPACLLALAGAVSGRMDRWLVGVAGASAFVGLLISGTRSSVLVAVLLLVGLAVYEAQRRRLISTHWVAIGLAGGVLLLGGAVAMGVAQRFWQSDAPATGLDFREQELRSFLDLPPRDLILGQGFGGRYVGKNVLGAQVEAGWSHSLPVFIALKIGVVGLLGVGVLLIAAARRTAGAYRRSAGPETRAMIACAAIALVGTLAMSLTLGRAALPEGAVIIVLSLAMLAAFK